jgi:protein-S-isoprenylcysteine O-methyltransferase Ste14
MFALPVAMYSVGLSESVRNTQPLAWAHAAAVLLQQGTTVALFGLLVVLFAVRRPLRGARATWPRRLVALAGTFILTAAGYLPIEVTASTAALLAASGLVSLGTIVAVWSLATLGRCFGLLPEARGLVVRGPYRLVRHPAYLGEMIAGLGFVVSRPALPALALFATFVLLQYVRTRLEERALMAVFPDDYLAYQTRVPRLVPGWR